MNIRKIWSGRLFWVLFLLIGIALHWTSGMKSPAVPVAKAPTIFFDDIVDKNVGFNFAKAFAMEPECIGLSLMTWENNPHDEDRALGVSAKWQLSYNPIEPVFDRLGRAEFGYGPGQLFHFPNGPANGVDSKPDFFAESYQDAAKKVCFMVKGKGGTVK